MTDKPERPRKPEPPPDALAALNVQQRAFVIEYLANRGNATQAAVTAGYGAVPVAAVTGHRLLRNAKVQCAFREAFREAGLTPGEVIARLAEQAKASPVMFFDKPWRLNRHVLRRKGYLIKKLKVPGRGRPAEIELYDGQAALFKVGMHLGLFNEKVQHVGDQGGPVQHEFVVCVPEAGLKRVVEATGPKRA